MRSWVIRIREDEVEIKETDDRRMSCTVRGCDVENKKVMMLAHEDDGCDGIEDLMVFCPSYFLGWADSMWVQKV